MIVPKNLVFFLTLILPSILLAQAEIIFNDIHLNESLETVSQKLSSITEISKVITSEKPSFPLAKDREDHLVCSNLTTANGIINTAVFTFADNKLVYIEARGNAYKTLVSKRKDTARNYIKYEVYVKDRLFLNKEKDIAWIITKEAMHTNLFAWENPYLDPDYKTKKVSHNSKNLPVFLKMGTSLEEIKPLLEGNSDFTYTEELDGSDPNAQIQVNCFGVPYSGFPRKIEARFGNNKLNVVWILTAKGEEDRIRKALTSQFGDPIFVNEGWEIFDNWQVGLRKDKPEVLLMEKQIGLNYKSSYFKQ